MKIQLRKAQGNVLFGTVVATGIICLYLGSYLTLIRNENLLTRSSQTWNAAIPIAEAGVEEAFSRLKWDTNLTATGYGWNLIGTNYYIKTNYLNTNEYYVVGIFPGTTNHGPVIVSEGFAKPLLRTDFISRTIRVNTRARMLFGLGMVADQTINFSGDKVTIDSYDSADPLYSTNGQYIATKRKDNATVAVNSTLVSTTPSGPGLGNVDIYGKITTGPGSSKPYIGPQGIVGSSNYLANSANLGTIQSGAWTNDANFDLDSVDLPFTSAVAPPSGTGYKYVLGTGDYSLSDFSTKNNENVLITGNARLLVTSAIDLKGSFTIQTNASLQLYMSGASASINGVQNLSGRARNFSYYGTTNNTSLDIGANGAFTGSLYAPSAEIKLHGGGNPANGTDFSGSSVSKKTTLDGHFSFHYDEDLARNGPINGYVGTSWDELILSWNTIRLSNMTTTQVRAAE